MQETQEMGVQSLDWKIHGEGNGNQYNILAGKIPWTEEPGRLPSLGLQRVRLD